jgi:hypothetical protein
MDKLYTMDMSSNTDEICKLLSTDAYNPNIAGKLWSIFN